MTGALATGVNPHLTPALSSPWEEREKTHTNKTLSSHGEERVARDSEPGEVGLRIPRKRKRAGANEHTGPQQI